MSKPKVALYWAASCGGCDVAILDTNEKILEIADSMEIVFWPFALDFKVDRIESMPDGSVDLCLFNGAVRNSDQETIARLLRAKSKVMVALGACAWMGGIPALGNFSNREETLRRVYRDAPSNENPQAVVPETSTTVSEGELTLPAFFDTVLTLDQVVDVEYYVPGCPPPPELILKVLDDFTAGRLPAPGSVLAPEKTLCDECDRIRGEKKITRIRRPHEIVPDPKTCLLEQGILCCGPVTRAGCGARCIRANMPCRGCFGPAPNVADPGAKMLSVVASIYQGHDQEDIARMVEEVVDPAGTFYRFGLAASLLKRKRLPAKD